jgi:orotidine-5'-phosphate decarboxylase
MIGAETSSSSVSQSSTNNSSRNRLIVALDVPSAAAAQKLVQSIGDEAVFYKVGLQLFTAAGPAVVRELVAGGKKVFLDLKIHEIPNSAAGAVKSAAALGVDMVTVHAAGGKEMLKAAVEAAASGSKPLLVLAVTVLTSLSNDDLQEIGVMGDAKAQALRLARLAQQSGCGGLVASANEVAELRGAVGRGMKLVIPGIRPAGADKQDQSRTATPGEALRAGADYLVVGRPINGAADPAAAARAIVKEIDGASRD